MNTTILKLSDKIRNAGFARLFLNYNDDLINEIWQVTDISKKLKNICFDETIDIEVRFLAAEILFKKTKNFPDEDRKAKLAEVYAAILASDLSINANIWGMPGKLNGATGKHLLSMGHSIIPAFLPLLKNDSRIYYEGSEDATEGNAYQYRVKDFAAFFLSEVVNQSYVLHKNPLMRDIEIKQLKNLIENK
jgi:hypothetical protein